MKLAVKIICLIVPISAIYGCSNKMNSSFQKGTVRLDTTSIYFEHVIYNNLKEMAFETKEIKDFMEVPNENSFKIIYNKIRSGLYHNIHINIMSDTLFIIDVNGEEGGTARSIFWNQSDTCVKSETEGWEKNKRLFSKKDLARMLLVSSWDIKSLQKMDSVTFRLRKHNEWIQYGKCHYIATRIIFNNCKTHSDFWEFQEWANCEYYKNIVIPNLDY